MFGLHQSHDAKRRVGERSAQHDSEQSRATFTSLIPLFRPRSIAVIGASRDQSSIGFRIVEAILDSGFQGIVHPVNPKAEEIAGSRVFPNVKDIPDAPDLAMVVVRRDIVPDVIRDCAERGIKAIIVITSGFAEVGEEGRLLQEDLKRYVRTHGMRMIGPNCLGLVNTHPDVQLNATFIPFSLAPGSIAVSSDSGALGVAILRAATRLNLGISSFVSVGNRADVSTNDLLEYWEHDEETKVILLYLESLGNPRRFSRIARRVSGSKPIVAVKAGRTNAGQRAAGSHTAALAASETAVTALFHQTGVLRTETLEELLNLVAGFSSQRLPKGNRVGIITNAGGPGILCSDMCEAQGLHVAEFSSNMRSQLSESLPAIANAANPLDLTAEFNPDLYRRSISTVLASGEIDALIVIYVVAGLTCSKEITAAIAEGVERARVKHANPTPVLACIMPGLENRTLPVSETEKIPCFLFPEEPARVLGAMAGYARWREKPDGKVTVYEDVDAAAIRKLCRTVLAERGEGWLSTEETYAVLKEAGLPVLPGELATTPEEAVSAARSIGYPVAVKLASKQIIHKTEIGGVHLDLETDEEVRRSFKTIKKALATVGKEEQMDGVLVQPMVSGGTEVFVGMTEDASFGPVLAFGLGGIHVEILGDVTFRVCPLTDQDAHDMIQSIRGHQLFEGYRHHPPADTDALAELLLRVSQMVDGAPEIGELDLNPVFAMTPGEGVRIADARISVSDECKGTEIANTQRERSVTELEQDR